jgi:hypothetical protein
LLRAGADEVADAALELGALPAALLGGVDRLEQRDLRQNDVGFVGAQPVEGGKALAELVRIVGKALRDSGDDAGRDLGARGHIIGDRHVLADDLPAIFGDILDPVGVDLAAVIVGKARGALGPELCLDLGGDDVRDIVAQQLDVAVKRSAGVVGRKARLDLLVGQPLQLSSLATHSSALRVSLGQLTRSCRTNG